MTKRAEFVYFSGHGLPASWYFRVAKDHSGAWCGNARIQNVRWVGFSSCQTLRVGPYVSPGNSPLTYWLDSFQGSYMLLGIHSVMGDVPFRFIFGFNMPTRYTLFPVDATFYPRGVGKYNFQHERRKTCPPVCGWQLRPGQLQAATCLGWSPSAPHRDLPIPLGLVG